MEDPVITTIRKPLMTNIRFTAPHELQVKVLHPIKALYHTGSEVPDIFNLIIRWICVDSLMYHLYILRKRDLVPEMRLDGPRTNVDTNSTLAANETHLFNPQSESLLTKES
jgi:hypothetical protein